MTPLDDLAERLVPTAARLTVAVHDGEPGDSHDALAGLSVLELRALCVVLAAMVPDDETLEVLLAWTRGVGPVSNRQAARNRARMVEAVSTRQASRARRSA